MPFLTIAGIDVLVTDLSEQEPTLIGDTGRSFNGTWRGDTSGEIRAWRGTALEVAASDYHALRSAVRRGTVEVQGDSIYGGWSRTMRVTMAGSYVRDGASYLVVPGFTMEDAQVHDLAYLLAPPLGVSAWDFSRASTAFYIDEFGVLQEAASGEARTEHYVEDAVTGLTVPGWLLEMGRTNQILWSRDVTNAAWSKDDVTTARNQIGVDGVANTATRLTEGSATDVHGFLAASGNRPTITAGQSVAMQAAIRGGARRYYMVAVASATSSGFGVILDTETGTLTDQQAGGSGFSIDDWSVRALANDLYEVRFAGVYNATSVIPHVRPCLDSVWPGAFSTAASGLQSYAGDGASFFDVDAIQVETNVASATSFVETEGSTAARAAETLYLDLPSGVSTPTALAVYGRVRVPYATNGGITNAGLFRIGAAATATNLFQLFWQSTTALRLTHSSGGSSVTADVTTPTTAGSTLEFLALLAADGTPTLITSVDGGAVSSATGSALALASAWDDTRIYLNSLGSSNRGAMTLLRNTIKPGVPTGGTAEENLIYMRGEAA